VQSDADILQQKSDGIGTVEYILRLSCPDRPGIVADVTTHLFESGFNILESQQFEDSKNHHFFARIHFNGIRGRKSNLWAGLERLAKRYQMDWKLRERGQPQRVLLMASKFDHCLADLLYRYRIGELTMRPVGIVSNHQKETYAHLDFGDIPFHYLPVDRDTKLSQEVRLKAIILDAEAELVVLARYMQVLSNEMVLFLEGRCINIHHSFLPGFKGAKPYHQAHMRGVKIIGATAHYVTAELDEGPIIEQDVERVSHRDTPEELIRKGRDIERRVLARAVRYHLADRIILNGHTTVVFPE